jgi:hypothetical protein
MLEKRKMQVQKYGRTNNQQTYTLVLQEIVCQWVTNPVIIYAISLPWHPADGLPLYPDRHLHIAL